MHATKKALANAHPVVGPLTRHVWVVALGRYGSGACPNPWNTYEGDYSDASLVRFGLSVRRKLLDQEDAYLSCHALAILARYCKLTRLQNEWKHLELILPNEGEWPEEE